MLKSPRVHRDPTELPRFNSARPGVVFDRLIARENLPRVGYGQAAVVARILAELKDLLPRAYSQMLPQDQELVRKNVTAAIDKETDAARKAAFQEVRKALEQ